MTDNTLDTEPKGYHKPIEIDTANPKDAGEEESAVESWSPLSDVSALMPEDTALWLRGRKPPADLLLGMSKTEFAATVSIEKKKLKLSYGESGRDLGQRKKWQRGRGSAEMRFNGR